MILDAQNRFSASQAVTTAAVGTNVIDLQVNRSIGNGTPMAVAFFIEVAADQGTGDESYEFQVEYATNAAQTTGRQLIGGRLFEAGTPTAPAQDANLLVAGFTVIVPIPPTKLSESAQFLGIRYVTAGTTPIITASAFLVPQMDIDATNDYANNYTIV
jgi:hypothetical protein